VEIGVYLGENEDRTSGESTKLQEQMRRKQSEWYTIRQTLQSGTEAIDQRDSFVSKIIIKSIHSKIVNVFFNASSSLSVVAVVALAVKCERLNKTMRRL
jgi:hypothetical protein